MSPNGDLKFVVLTLMTKVFFLTVGIPTIIQAQSIAPGDHAEFPLRPPSEKATVGQSPIDAEKVIFRTGNYDEFGLNRTIENIQTPTLTVYRPAIPAHGKSAIVICPGGGYAMEVIDREGHAIARYFAANGLVAAVLKYRLPTTDTFEKGIPHSQVDAMEAVRYLRRRVNDWQINEHRIGIMGFSAGGHLAGSTAMLAAANDGSRPDFAVLLYPVALMHGEYMHVGSRDRLLGPTPSPARVAEFSLEKRVRDDLPPFFICHATNDKVVPLPNAELLAEALRQVKVPTELLIVKSGGHGFALGRDQESAKWKEQFLIWLDTLP